MSAPSRERGRMIECVCCGRLGRNNGRGLIRSCYARVEAAGDLDEYPKYQRRSVDLVTDALALRRRYGQAERSGFSDIGRAAFSDRGITWAGVAAELGVNPRTLEKARERAGWPDV